MKIKVKKIMKYFVMLLVGFSLVFYGVINMVIKDKSAVEITDDEIIRRAKELGLVGIEEYYLEKLEKSE